MDITRIVAHRGDEKSAEFVLPVQIGDEELLYVYHDLEKEQKYRNERPAGLTGYPETNVLFGPGGDTIPFDEPFQRIYKRVNPMLPASGFRGLLNKWNKNKFDETMANFITGENTKPLGTIPKYPSKLIFGGASVLGVPVEWLGGYGVPAGEGVYKLKTLDVRKLPEENESLEDYKYAIHHLTNATTSILEGRQVINPFPDGRNQGHSYYMILASKGLDVYIKAGMVKPVTKAPNPFWPPFLLGAT